MTDQKRSELGSVPDACTLPTGERPLRAAEFDTLVASASQVDRIDATTLRLHLDGPSGAEVRDLTARESECCSFFQFRMTGDVDPTITVPPTHVGVLDALQEKSHALQEKSHAQR